MSYCISFACLGDFFHNISMNKMMIHKLIRRFTGTQWGNRTLIQRFWRQLLQVGTNVLSIFAERGAVLPLQYCTMPAAEMITMDMQKLLSNGNRIRTRISEALLSIFRGFRLLEIVVHCTVIHWVSSEASFQPSAPWLRVCLWCNLWTVELCQVCQHESVPGVAR